jgi:hypothetical protein
VTTSPSEVRLGSIASVWPDHGDFRSTLVNGHSQDRRACLKGAISDVAGCKGSPGPFWRSARALLRPKKGLRIAAIVFRNLLSELFD